MSGALKTRLEPQDRRTQAPPCISNPFKVRLGQPNTKASPSHLPQYTGLPLASDLMAKAPLGSISQRLDDMVSTTPFGSYIISYELPKGFLVPKFTMYDGTSNLFDHLMHFWQLMTLNISNDVLLFKVFSTNLHGPTLSWFHRFPHNSINYFQDVSKAFVSHNLCPTRQKQNISTLQNIKMQENESLREFMKQFGQVVLQTESYSKDVIQKIFKRSISLNTPFFESLTKK